MSIGSQTRWKAVFGGLGEPVVLALGITQTIGYGTLYYAYGVMAPALARDFAVGLDGFFAVFTVGLLFGGLFAPFVGRALDRRGSRIVMTLGSLAASLALLFCAAAPSLWVFSAAVVLMEFAACLVLYEAAFAGLTQIFGHDARRRITAVTLIAGFASTLFWPLTQALLDAVDWRWTFALFAGAHVLVCAPLHGLFLREARPQGFVPDEEARATGEPASHIGPERRRALVLYATAICVSGMVYSSVPVHMLRIIESEGFTPAKAALIAMVMGPAQVVARIAEIVARSRFDSLVTGRVALLALVLSTLVLIAFTGSTAAAIAFAALYGVSQGLITIARGTVPLQLFGARGYATLVGRITGLRFLVNAAGPFAFALAATHGGVGLAIGLNAAAAAIAFAVFWRLRRPAEV